MNKSTADALQNMGIGKLGDPNNIFVRKFRWTLESESLDSNFIKYFNIDHVNKIVKFSVYEVILENQDKIDIHDWADKMKDDLIPRQRLIFKTFDGIGSKLYEYKFFGLKLKEMKQDFDYSSSEVSTIDFTLSYAKFYRKVFKQVQPHCGPEVGVCHLPA